MRRRPGGRNDVGRRSHRGALSSRHPRRKRSRNGLEDFLPDEVRRPSEIFCFGIIILLFMLLIEQENSAIIAC